MYHKSTHSRNGFFEDECIHLDTMQSEMRKDTALSFRVASTLKAELESLAMKEGRSVAQVCEALIRGGLEGYKKEGSKYLQRFLLRRKETPT